MSKAFSQGLKDELSQFVRSFGAYRMQIADASSGFKDAVQGCHPRDVLTNCNSVVVFGIYVGTDYYRSIEKASKTVGDNRIMHLLRDWLQYRVADFLREKGCNTTIPRGMFDRETLTSRLSYKLAAFESGLGVYGKCGIIITPEYGPRVNFGVVLTDVMLEPDPLLTGFNPCRKCRVCVDLCPPKAIREGLTPPRGHDRRTCNNFILGLREKTGDKTFLCGYCYDNCPVGKTARRGFTLSRYKTLTHLKPREREILVKETLSSIRN